MMDPSTVLPRYLIKFDIVGHQDLVELTRRPTQLSLDIFFDGAMSPKLHSYLVISCKYCSENLLRKTILSERVPLNYLRLKNSSDESGNSLPAQKSKRLKEEAVGVLA